MADAANETYPTIKFFLKHGNTLAWLIGIAIAAYGIYGTYSAGSWACAVVGVAAGWFGYMAMKCIREVLHLVADTLMPQ